MTTEIVHGPPGSFKTAVLLYLYAIAALKAGRVVCTNVRGFDDLERVIEVYDLDLPETARIISVPFDISGFEKMARWWHWAPPGSVVIMDEGQRVYPTRLRTLNCFDYSGDDSEVAPTVEEAFDTHRHKNYDIYISTTNIAKIHKEIRQVCEYAYRHKNLAGLLPGMTLRYKRVKHDPENSGKSITHCIGSSIQKIDKRIFDVYKSTQTGKVKDVESKVSLFSQPKLIFVFFVIIGSISFVGYTANDRGSIVPYAQASSSVPSGSLGSEEGVQASNQDTRVSSRRVPLRAFSQQDSVVAILDNIQYVSAVVKIGSKKDVWFTTKDYGHLRLSDLLSLQVSYKKLGDIYMLSYGQKTYLLVYGDVTNQTKHSPET